ncbi:MAG: hypothetical protein AB7J28_06000 [Hyphomonadaceae bacterium]
MTAQAWADPVSLAPVRFSEDLQETLAEDYGAREGAYLEERIGRALTRALARAGGEVSQGASVSIETTIVDARPNRPTFQQLVDEPSLDFGRSISTGGAELVAVIRGPDGQPLGEVRHRYFTSTLQEVHPAGTWNDADRSINRFARRVAEEYARVAH